MHKENGEKSSLQSYAERPARLDLSRAWRGGGWLGSLPPPLPYCFTLYYLCFVDERIDICRWFVYMRILNWNPYEFVGFRRKLLIRLKWLELMNSIKIKKLVVLVFLELGIWITIWGGSCVVIILRFLLHFEYFLIASGQVVCCSVTIFKACRLQLVA